VQSLAVEPSGGDHALGNESAVPLGAPAATEAVHASVPLTPGSDAHFAGSIASEPEQHLAELLQGTSAPHGNPAPMPVSGAAVSPVTAEMLQAAMAGVQHAAEKPGATVDVSQHGSAELGQILADALAVGSSGKPDVESLLHAVGGPVHDQVLAHTALGASGAHELFGGVPVEDRMLMMHDTIMLHQLAAPLH
jgi:hypothetical protein